VENCFIFSLFGLFLGFFAPFLEVFHNTFLFLSLLLCANYVVVIHKNDCFLYFFGVFFLYFYAKCITALFFIHKKRIFSVEWVYFSTNRYFSPLFRPFLFLEMNKM